MRPLRVGEAHATFESWGGPMGPLRVEGGPMCGGIKQVNIYPHVGGYLVTIFCQLVNTSLLILFRNNMCRVSYVSHISNETG